MRKAALYSPGPWVPIMRSEAKRRGLIVESLHPRYRASDLRLVLDQSAWFEMPLGPRWIVAFRLTPQRGQPVISEVRVYPDEPKNYGPGRWSGEYGAPATVPRGGLTSRILRMIRTKQVFTTDLRSIMARKITVEMEKVEIQKANKGRRALKGTRREGTWTKEEWESVFPAIPFSTVKPPATRGRQGRSDQELARMAAVYERATLAHRPPIHAVAKAHGLSLGKARDAIRRARVRGLLEWPQKQGIGGSLLTPPGKMLSKKKHTKGGKHGTKR